MAAARCFIVLAVLLRPSGVGAGETGALANGDPRIEPLLARMTLDEKVGQLVQYAADTQAADYPALIERGAIGSMLNAVGARQTNELQRIAVERSRLHIPLLFGYDVIHGHRTTFPVPLGLAASWDPALVSRVARVAATEARQDGITWVFSPMVDIARDPRWGRIVESAGEDTFLGSAIARAWISGYQQGDLGRPDSVAAGVKHFAGYGAVAAGRDYAAVDMSDTKLRQDYLPPYRAAVEAGAASVMSAFNTVNGVPASANPFLLGRILRDEWNFRGFVVSDWGAVAELRNHGVADSAATAARKAIEAGVDVDMQSGTYAAVLAAEVRAGHIAESVVDQAVRRVLRVKFALGLFERPYAPEGESAAPTRERRAEAREAALESIVLLKNGPAHESARGGRPMLPLDAGVGSVALIGPLADSASDMLGSWPARGDARFVVTLREALRQRLGPRLRYAKGCDAAAPRSARLAGQDLEEQEIDAASQLAAKAGVAILALGEQADRTGEAASRADLVLPGRQQELLERVVATGTPTVLVLFTGRPAMLNWAAAHVPAIVEAWFPGIEGGPAVADILLGEVSPSGKLPIGFPRSVGQLPLHYAELQTGRPADASLRQPSVPIAERYTSRYLDEENSARYPFGWGLSYTTFSYSRPIASRDVVPLRDALRADAPALSVGVEVANSGGVAATEVVQLYLRNAAASVVQPVRELKGFARLSLAPGESRRVEFPLGLHELGFYDANGAFVVEPSRYQVFVGGNSLAAASTGFEVR